MKKRILSLLLALCAAASLLAVPAGAAPAAAAGFTDVSDRSTAMAAECMRLLGAMDGYSPSTFGPDGQVTRAQFCKMAVYAMNGEGQLGRYRTVTVYPDVKPSHWAAPYINMASDSGRGATGEDKTDRSIIKGYADGKFHPASPVSYGQAVTILMRMLGYSDADMGGIWPDGYLASAEDVGLTDGVEAAPAAVLSRGQAARLFLNLLRSNVKGGGNYGESIAVTSVKGMLLTSGASGPDGSETGMQLSGESTVYAMANGKASTGALNGARGTLLLNKAGKVLTFVPELAAANRTVTFASGTADQLTTSTGETFSIKSGTKMVVNGKQGSWTTDYTWLTPGMSLTLYIGAGGSVDYIFAGTTSTSTNAVVVYTKGSTDGFSGLAGGNTRYAIYKNGVAATAGDMRPYDVAIYNPGANAIRVSDTRLTGVYENAEPNLSNPSTITVMGMEFKVLASAADTMSKLKLGAAITLLLTEDNQVAGAIAADASVARGNAVGVVQNLSATSATVQLLGGMEVTGAVNLTEAEVDRMKGQLVSVASGRKGQLSLSRLAGGVPGDLDVTAEKLGPKLLADNVVIYQTGGEKAESVTLNQIPSARIPSSGVVYARTNWAGKIDLLVLSNVTGSDYIFGRLNYTAAYDELQPDGSKVHHKASVSILAGGKTYGPYSPSFTIEGDTTGEATVRDGDYVGAKLTTKGTTTIDSLFVLTKYTNIPNNAWVSASSVTIAGRSYTVPSDVLCYNKANNSWVTLNEARAFATRSTLYADKSGYIRAVEVGQ